MTTIAGDAPSQPLAMGRISVEAKPVENYLQAVGDELPIYRESGLAPPLYATASSLGLLLKTLNLPPGAIHSLQEVETLAPIRMGQELRATATLERPRQRAGLTFITASCALESDSVGEAMSAKSTVMVADGDASHPERDRGTNQRLPSESPSDLPVVSRAITQERLVAYSAASGDDNPLHLDAEFASGTRFGGIIAHGMLTLAFISEMMTASLGELWLTGGSLRVRFKGAARPGDQVETWGQAASNDKSLSYTVGVRNSLTGEDLITGTAKAR